MTNRQSPEDGSNRLVLWLIHGGGVLFVTLVFLLLVMTAVAQQEVLASIKQQQLSLGYSAALTVNNEARGINDELRGLRGEARGLTRQLRSDQVAFNSNFNADLLRRASLCSGERSTSPSAGFRRAAAASLRPRRTRADDVVASLGHEANHLCRAGVGLRRSGEAGL